MMRACLLFLCLCFSLFSSLKATADEEKLKLPRFASLRSGEVNMRVGPGPDYEIAWIYHRKTLPVEIIEEFDTWRKIRDAEGTVGWVHQSMLSGRRTAMVMGERRVLRRDPDLGARPRAYLDPGIIVMLDECRTDWCEVEVPGRADGWIARQDLWGIYPGETLP